MAYAGASLAVAVVAIATYCYNCIAQSKVTLLFKKYKCIILYYVAVQAILDKDFSTETSCMVHSVRN